MQQTDAEVSMSDVLLRSSARGVALLLDPNQEVSMSDVKRNRPRHLKL
jgi:hypothetical protein